MDRDHPPAPHPLEPCHLDIGQREKVHDGRPRHPHHVCGDDQRHGQCGQESGVQPGGQRHSGFDAGQAGEPSQLHGEEEDQDIGDEVFRERDRGQRGGRDQLVQDRIAVKRGQKAQKQRQRDGDHRGMAGQEEGVEGPDGDQLSDRALVGERHAEVALQRARDPGQIAQGGRLVQAQLLAQGGQGLGGGGLAQRLGRDVAGQKLDRQKDHRRDDQQRQRPQGQTPQQDLEDGSHTLPFCLDLKSYMSDIISSNGSFPCKTV